MTSCHRRGSGEGRLLRGPSAGGKGAHGHLGKDIVGAGNSRAKVLRVAGCHFYNMLNSAGVEKGHSIPQGYEHGFGHNRRQILTQEFTQKSPSTMRCERDRNQHIGHQRFSCARTMPHVTAFYSFQREEKAQGRGQNLPGKAGSPLSGGRPLSPDSGPAARASERAPRFCRDSEIRIRVAVSPPDNNSKNV